MPFDRPEAATEPAILILTVWRPSASTGGIAVISERRQHALSINALRATGWMAVPVMAEVVARLIGMARRKRYPRGGFS